MTFADAMGDDFLLCDGLEPVTLERVDGQSAESIVSALRRQVTTTEADRSDGKYLASETSWHLPASTLAEPPALGDAIVDATGRRWTVIAVDSLGFGSRLRCRARDLALAHGMDQRVDILRASWSKAPDGSPVATWETWRVNMAARVQPWNDETVDDPARACTRRRLRVYLADRILLDHNYQIVHGTSRYWIRGRERLDSLEHLQTLLIEPVESASS